MMAKYRDYWIAVLVCCAIISILTTLKQQHDSFPMVVSLLLGIVFVAIFVFAAGLIIMAVSWIFTRNFSFFRLIRITAIVSVVTTIVHIVGLFLELAR